MYTPRVFEKTEFPASLQHLLRKSIAQNLLRGNAFLEESVWESLLLDHDFDSSTNYIRLNLTTKKVRKILDCIKDLKVSERKMVDVDYAIAAFLQKNPPGPLFAKKVIKSGLPNSAQAALMSEKVSLEDKKKLARLAYRAFRILFLVSKDEISDEEAWDIALAPETLEQSCAGTILDNSLKENQIYALSQLLYTRPGLKEKALASSEPWVLMSVSSVFLNDSEQEKLIKSLELHWRGPEALEVIKRLSSYYHAQVDALGNLASTPWCSEASWQYIVDKFKDSEFEKGYEYNSEYSKIFPCRIKDNALLRMDPLGYNRHHIIRHRDSLPPTDVRTGSASVVKKWLESAYLIEIPTAPYIALYALENKSLGRVSASRRDSLQYLAPKISRVLKKHKRYAGMLRTEASRTIRTDFSPVQTLMSGPVSKATGANTVEDAVLFCDWGFSYLESLNLSESAWELILTFLFDAYKNSSGFETTLDDLVSMVASVVGEQLTVK